VSWTIAAEDTTSRRGALWDAGTNGLAIGAFPGPNTWGVIASPNGCPAGAVTSDQNIGNTAAPLSVSDTCATGDYAAQSIPDIVSSLRVDQAWGSAQISGALHQVRGNFYGNDTQSTIVTGPAAFTGNRPSDAWGWAVGAGIVINLPWNPGDKFWIEGEIGEGTPCYVGFCQDGVNGTYVRFDGHNVGAGWGLDGVFANVVAPAQASPAALGVSNFSGIILPTVFNIAAAVEHYWTPALRTSLFGNVTGWEAGDAITATGGGSDLNKIMCSSPVGPVRTFSSASPNFATGGVIGCNFSFEIVGIGSRTVWNPVKNLDIGVEVMWSQIHQHMQAPNPAAGSGVLYNFGGGGNRPAGLYAPSDEQVVSGMFRVQRNFWP